MEINRIGNKNCWIKKMDFSTGGWWIGGRPNGLLIRGDHLFLNYSFFGQWWLINREGFINPHLALLWHHLQRALRSQSLSKGAHRRRDLQIPGVLTCHFFREWSAVFWLSEQLGWTAAFDESSGVWQSCGNWLAPSHWYLRCIQIQGVPCWVGNRWIASIGSWRLSSGCSQVRTIWQSNYLVPYWEERKEPGVPPQVHSGESSACRSGFVSGTRSGSGGKAAVLQDPLGGRSLALSFCLTTTCRFVLRFCIGGIPLNIKTQRREHCPGRSAWNTVDHLQFDEEFLISDRVHLCLSFWDFHPLQVEYTP